MTFQETDAAASSPAAATRVKRQLADLAIAQASGSQWSDAADTNRKLLEMGAEAETEAVVMRCAPTFVIPRTGAA